MNKETIIDLLSKYDFDDRILTRMEVALRSKLRLCMNCGTRFAMHTLGGVQRYCSPDCFESARKGYWSTYYRTKIKTNPKLVNERRIRARKAKGLPA